MNRSQGLRIAAVLVLILLLAAGALYVLRQRPGIPPTTTPGAPTSIEQGAPWEVAFTTPIRPPDDPSRHVGGIDTRLVRLMDTATRTLDVASYDFDLANVADAMARAVRRGVRVRMVTDTDTVENTREPAVQPALQTVRQAGITIVEDRRGAIMHHKFTVVDDEFVSMGSWNYTDGDTYRLNNNVAIFHSRELAENYTAEFEKMFIGGKFGPSKSGGAQYPDVSLGDTRVTTFFAPQDQVADHLVERINAAQGRIHFLAFSFTHNAMGDAMIRKHADGIEVRGVFETTGSNTQFSEFGKMRRAGMDVLQDGNPYVMHHKVILLDDRTTIFGSFNYSAAADEDNDENLLIIDDPLMTARFEQEFQRVRDVARAAPARK